VVSILEGRNFFCKFLKRSKSPMIIIGKSFLNKLTLSSFNILTSILKSNFKICTAFWNGLNIFNSNSSDFSYYDIGLNNNFFFASHSYDLVYVVENSNSISKTVKSKFIVFQGHHGCLNAQNADVVLPCTSFAEKKSTHVNCEGRLQYSQSCTLPIGKSKNSSEILLTFMNSLVSNSERNKSDHLSNLKLLLPPFGSYSYKISSNYLIFPTFFNSLTLINNSYISSSLFDNFYRTDIVSQSSSNMSKSSKELLDRSPFKI